MKIYTRRGDAGETGLFGGKRLPKSHLRIESYGTVDELNSHIGYLSDIVEDEKTVTLLRSIQSTLFTIGSQLATDPDKDLSLPQITASDIEKLEQAIDRMEEKLPQLKAFVLPSGHPHGSAAHIARTVCRRAERRVVELSMSESVDPILVTYLNRLSDLLFVMARYVIMLAGGQEVEWKSGL